MLEAELIAQLELLVRKARAVGGGQRLQVLLRGLLRLLAAVVAAQLLVAVAGRGQQLAVLERRQFEFQLACVRETANG